ncbi:MAG: hypothetical protein AMK71_02275 [Nitrospira bacterium SG8_35_4]|nr:MAG: hypothetical protein AMK71_02275 [Nitrospira bacterium SG8_35_4]
MRILLIGNFAPPYEEESLHNLSLLKKLEEDGHECSVLNTSDKPSSYKNFIDSSSYVDFVFKLLRSCWKKDIVHFSTKGYLRLGLLKLMTSIAVGKCFFAKTFITIHSELFSVAGQMRSPVGGRQTLFTSFTLADKIICCDKDTYDVASMYMKKTNFELIPSFLYTPREITESDSSTLKKLGTKESAIVFANVTYPSFLFDILKELLSNYPLRSDTAIVISLSDKPTSKLQHVLEEMGSKMQDQIVFIEPDDVRSALMAYSKAEIVLRPMSCDGISFFKNFAISVKKLKHVGDYIYFPSGLLFIKEGSAAEMCVCIMNTMLCVEAGTPAELSMENAYERILQLYGE